MHDDTQIALTILGAIILAIAILCTAAIFHHNHRTDAIVEMVAQGVHPVAAKCAFVGRLDGAICMQALQYR